LLSAEEIVWDSRFVERDTIPCFSLRVLASVSEYTCSDEDGGVVIGGGVEDDEDVVDGAEAGSVFLARSITARHTLAIRCAPQPDDSRKGPMAS